MHACVSRPVAPTDAEPEAITVHDMRHGRAPPAARSDERNSRRSVSAAFRRTMTAAKRRAARRCGTDRDVGSIPRGRQFAGGQATQTRARGVRGERQSRRRLQRAEGIELQPSGSDVAGVHGRAGVGCNHRRVTVGTLLSRLQAPAVAATRSMHHSATCVRRSYALLAHEAGRAGCAPASHVRTRGHAPASKTVSARCHGLAHNLAQCRRENDGSQARQDWGNRLPR